MSELIANFSGAGQVIPGIPVRTEHVERERGACGHLHGPSRRLVFAGVDEMVSLSDLFQKEVLGKTEWAWYVDYFTEDPAMYNVYLLCLDPLIRWSNENIRERDPDDPESNWSPEDVAKWFDQDDEGSKATYEHVVKFHSENVAHRLHLTPFGVTLDDEDRWDEYVEFGVRGAMGVFGEKRAFNHLDGIEVYRV
jgi:hypothetical protein